MRIDSADVFAVSSAFVRRARMVGGVVGTGEGGEFGEGSESCLVVCRDGAEFSECGCMTVLPPRGRADGVVFRPR